MSARTDRLLDLDAIHERLRKKPAPLPERVSEAELMKGYEPAKAQPTEEKEP